METIIISICLWGNSQGCYKSAEAYYKYEKLDEIVDRFNEKAKREYPIIVATLPVLAAIEKKEAAFPVYHNIFFGVKEQGTINNSNEFKTTLRWSRDF